MTFRHVSAAVSAALLLVAASPAQAHLAKSLAGGFGAGFVHPFSGWDHLLAMISVGLWGATLRRPLIVLLPAIFPMMMAVGGVVGMSGLPLPPVELGIAVSVLVLGLAIACAWRAPVPVACAIVAVFALFHGYAHGIELPSMADPVAFSAGFVVATGTLHLVGIGLGLADRLRHGAVAIRVIGGGIAAVGAALCVSALA